MLERALVTTIGPLDEVWNLWRVEDAGHFGRATATLGDERVFAKHADVLETLRESKSRAPGRGRQPRSRDAR